MRVCVVASGGFRTWVSRVRYRQELWGGEMIRLQMLDEMRPFLPEDIELDFTAFRRDGRYRSVRWTFNHWLRVQRTAIFILMKQAALHVRPEQLERLRDSSGAIGIGVDLKDSDLSQVDLSLYDFHIVSSSSAKSAIDTEVGGGATASFSAILLQRHDSRIDALRFNDLDELSALYLGLPKNTSIPQAISGRIDRICVLKAADMDPILHRLQNYNLHYAVRPDPSQDRLRAYKPFTKGVTAAACRSNIIVNRGVDGATEFLGEDYPYLITSNEPADVTEAFERAQHDFGGPEWRRGLDIMADVRERVSPRALARQFTTIVRRAAEQRTVTQ